MFAERGRTLDEKRSERGRQQAQLDARLVRGEVLRLEQTADVRARAVRIRRLLPSLIESTSLSQ